MAHALQLAPAIKFHIIKEQHCRGVVADAQVERQGIGLDVHLRVDDRGFSIVVFARFRNGNAIGDVGIINPCVIFHGLGVTAINTGFHFHRFGLH